MGRMRQLSPEERREARVRFFEAIDSGGVPLAEAVRQMRVITGMTQAQFAERVAGISRQALARIEQGRGSPSVATLDRIGEAFGLQVGFVRRPR